MQIEEQAKAWVENHEDIEVRRMYGHHYRAFIAGAKQQQLNTDTKLIATAPELLQALISIISELEGEVLQSSMNLEITNARTIINKVIEL